MIEPGRALRLPPRRMTGFTSNVSELGLYDRLVVSVTDAQSWFGKPVGIPLDAPQYPMLWTPQTVSGFRGLTVSAYAGEFFYSVAVARQNGFCPFFVPRMVLYDDAIGYQACVAQGAALAARHASAMITPTDLSHRGGGPALGTGNVLAGCLAPTAMYMSTDTFPQRLPDGVETEWSGGEVLLLASCQLGLGLTPFAFSDGVSPDEFLSDASDHCRDLWQRFAPRYFRLRGHAVTFTTYDPAVSDPATIPSRAFQLAGYNTAIGGLPGVTLEDVGVVDNSADPNAYVPLVQASFEQAIKDFFGYT